MRWLAALLLGSSCWLAVPVAAQLTERERKGIEDTLFIGNMKPQDLEFARRPFNDPYRLGLVNLALDKPLEAADRLMALHSGAKTASLPTVLEAAVIGALGDPKAAAANPGPAGGPIEGLPEGLQKPVAGLMAWVRYANGEVKAALKNLKPEEVRLLIDSLPNWAVQEPGVKFDFVHGKPVEQKRILDLLGRVDHKRIRSAAVALTSAVERAIPALKACPEDVPTKLKLKVQGMTVVIAGKGPDRHDDTDAVLTIDLGGANEYVGRHGAGVGYASALIDMGGNSRFDVKDLSVGSAILGIGVARVCGGNCVFKGRSLCFGAGLAGVGVFAKDGGDDAYVSTSLAQGFGEFGVGVCLDSGGADDYRLGLMGQGAGLTQGCGWLVDQGGNDLYRAGGVVVHAPLFKDVHYSFAQGYGMGYREDAGGVSGGVGLLSDFAGDDAYLAETYAQAASYWFGLGSLYDALGNDTYSGYHYCQASAMHCSGSYLFDLAGDDSYTVKFGAAHAIGHDYGVAFLLDRAGNDLYAGRDSSPGLGSANGLGLFVDGQGADRYIGPPGRGIVARGTGSLGVFVDLDGQDRFAEGLADGEALATTTWGVAYDEVVAAAVVDEGAVPARPKPVPGSLAKPSDKELAGIYDRATQWGVGTAQEEVAENVDKLISIGVPALDWMLDNRLKGADRLQNRAFVAVVKALGPDGALALGRKMLAKLSDQEMLNALGIASEANVTDVGAFLPGLIDNPALQRAAVSAAGVLKAAACVPALSRLCLSEDRLLARAAMVSLSQIGTPETVATAQAMLAAPDLLTRKAAIALIAKHPDKAFDMGQAMAREVEEGRARTGIQILATLNTDEALKAMATMLLDPRPGVRIEAALALDGRCPVEYRANLLSLRRDPVATVRAVARRVEPSR